MTDQREHADEQVERVAKAHPNYSHGHQGAYCAGCGQALDAIDGSFTEAWNQHLIRAALDAMGLPSREDVAQKVADLVPGMTVLLVPDVIEPSPAAFAVADAILALYPAAPVRTVGSVEELEALPPRSRVTIDGGDDVMTKGADGEWRGGPYTLGESTWVGLPEDPLDSPPVACIYRPDATVLTPAHAPAPPKVRARCLACGFGLSGTVPTYKGAVYGTSDPTDNGCAIVTVTWDEESREHLRNCKAVTTPAPRATVTRGALIAVLHQKRPLVYDARIGRYTENSEALTDAILALLPAAPVRTVGSVEELEALPVGTVILGPSGISAQRGKLGWWLSAVTQCETPLKSRAYAQNVGLPATVLTPAPEREAVTVEQIVSILSGPFDGTEGLDSFTLAWAIGRIESAATIAEGKA